MIKIARPRILLVATLTVLGLSASGCINQPTVVVNNNANSNTTTTTTTNTAVDLPPYYMSFHACDSVVADCTSPQNHQVYLAQSDDGISWQLVDGWEPFAGSVPDIVRRDNTLYVYSASGGGSVTTYDLATQTISTTAHITVSGLPDGFVDPAPHLDDYGNIVLFFMYCRSGGEPIRCFSPQGDDTSDSSNANKEFVIGSATEVAGSNGAEFTMASGDRAVTNNGTDPEVYFDGTQFVLYISHGPSFSVWTANELHGDYVQVSGLPSGMMTQGSGGVPSGLYDAASANYWSYAHTIDASGNTVIRRAVHATLSEPLTESDWEVVISGESVGLTKTTRVESPGIITNLF